MRVNPKRRIAIAACGFALWFLQGCSAKLPMYSWTTQDEALAVIRQRADSIKTIQAACDITLTDPNGQLVTFDGALVARNPGWLRIRAWKFNSAVFDVTMTPDGLWVMQGDSDKAIGDMPTQLDAKRVTEAWDLLSGAFFADDVVWMREKMWVDLERFVKPGPQLVLGERPGKQIVHAWVERKTLLPRRYQGSMSEQQTSDFDIHLNHYRLIGDIAVAHGIDMAAAAGRIVIRLREVTLNEEPAPGAFKPPSRAVKQP